MAKPCSLQEVLGCWASCPCSRGGGAERRRVARWFAI